MSDVKKLEIYKGADLVGTLYDEHPMKFVYDDAWHRHHKRAISPNLSLANPVHSGEAVEAYFENLLPEAGIRDLLKFKHQVTTTFGLLSVIGGDTASDLTIS